MEIVGKSEFYRLMLCRIRLLLLLDPMSIEVLQRYNELASNMLVTLGTVDGTDVVSLTIRVRHE